MKTPQRVMIVHPGPQFSVQDVFTGWTEAFHQLGIKTIDYNLGDRITFYSCSYLHTGRTNSNGDPQFKKAFPDRDTVIELASNGIMSTAYQFWPDVIVVVSAFFIPSATLDILRSRGHKVVLLFTESPYEENKQLARAEHCDLALLNDPLKLDQYDKIGVPAFYMPHAYRPNLHYPGPGRDDLETDFAFVGTGFGSRLDFFERMYRTGCFTDLDVTLAGNWQRAPAGHPCAEMLSHDPDECVDNALTAAIYRSAKIGLNLYRHEPEDNCQDGHAIGPREVEMAACGLFFLRDSRPESDAVFPMLPTFADAEDAAEQLTWWIKHTDERNEVALKARAAIRDRTFENNAKQLMKILDAL